MGNFSFGVGIDYLSYLISKILILCKINVILLEGVEKKRGAMNTSLALDRQTGEVFRSTVYNDDYSNRERVDMYSIGKNGNPDIAFCQKIDADILVKAYERDQLKGKLKEIAANPDEEDNAVIMLAKYKE